MRHFVVKENGREKEVIIAGTPEEMKDRSHMDYLEHAGREKAINELKNTPNKEESNFSKSEISAALRERRDYNNRIKSGTKKYY